MNCKVCNRKAVSKGYCAIHEKAYQNIMEKFEVWKEALTISWKGYLKEIVKNPLTGAKAKEVAEALLS